MLKVGDKAPLFELPDQDNKLHKLSDFKDSWVLVYFYPKDDTPGCTTEACSVRDNFSELGKAGLRVVGISTDTTQSHKKFEQKYDLNFTLLADADKKVVEDYGVWGEKKFMGKTYLGTKRTSFLIDPEGKIVKIYENVNPNQHIKEVLQDFKNLEH